MQKPRILYTKPSITELEVRFGNEIAVHATSKR